MTGEVFSAYGVGLAVTVAEPLAPKVHAVLPPVWEAADESDDVHRLDVGVLADGSFEVRVDDAPVAALRDPELAISVLASQVRAKIALHAPDHVFVHAGVVAVDGRAVLLPASSFAGKTTLVAALVRRGAAYLSDEYAVLDPAGGVHPYARSLSFRRDDRPGNDERSAAELGGEVAPGPCRAGAVLATRYVPGASWDPRPLSRGDAALALLEHTVAARTAPERVLPTLQAVTSGAAAWESPRGEADEVAAAILALI